MIVCLCHGISDRTVKLAVLQGAQTAEQVADVCGAGTGCGACVEDVERICGQRNGAPCTSAQAAAGGASWPAHEDERAAE